MKTKLKPSSSCCNFGELACLLPLRIPACLPRRLPARLTQKATSSEKGVKSQVTVASLDSTARPESSLKKARPFGNLHLEVITTRGWKQHSEKRLKDEAIVIESTRLPSGVGSALLNMQRPAPRPAQPGSLAVPTLPFDSEKNAESARNDSAISKDGLSLLKSSYGSSSSYALTAARLANSETDPRLTTRFNKSKFTIADRWQSVKRYVKTRLLQAPPATASLTNCTDIEHPTSSAKEWSSDTGLVIKHPLKSSTRMSEAGEELETIEVTVVDRDFGDILRGATLLSDSPSQTGDTPLVNGVPSRAGSIATGTDPKGSHAGGRETITGSSNFVAAQHTWRFLRWRIAPPLVFFFYSAFPDPHKEKVYHKESWYAAKTAALASACFLLIAWIATTASQPRPYSLYAKLGYSALGGLTIWPLLPSVAFDVPRKRPILWQILLFCGTWGLPYISLWDMWQCGFYRADNHCQGKVIAFILTQRRDQTDQKIRTSLAFSTTVSAFQPLLSSSCMDHAFRKRSEP